MARAIYQGEISMRQEHAFNICIKAEKELAAMLQTLQNLRDGVKSGTVKPCAARKRYAKIIRRAVWYNRILFRVSQAHDIETGVTISDFEEFIRYFEL